MKYATFFGGAINTISQEYHESVEIGEMLAKKGYTVKCGGYGGLMKAVCLGVSNQKGYSIGITCATFPTSTGNKYLTETIVAEDLFQRLKFLFEQSELFIFQKGGIGTLSELTLLLDFCRKKKREEQPTIVVIGKHWKETVDNLVCQILNAEEVVKLEFMYFNTFEEFKEYYD